MRRIYKSISRLALLLALTSPLARAQNTPVLSGAFSSFFNNNAGNPSFAPVVAPVFAAPIGQHLLGEGRFDFREFYFRSNGNSGPYEHEFIKSTQTLQLDYLATPKVTFVVGRFLIPFGTYNERLSAIWIQNFQNAPILFGLGTRTTGSGDGAQIRGVAYSDAKVQVNYLTWFSVRSNVGQFQAARAAGDRIDVYFPTTRVEIGTSYERFMQDTQYNVEGAHFWWLPNRWPLQVRSEYAHGPHAQGYWIETSFPASQLGGRFADPNSWLGRIEPLFRMQQIFRNSPGNGDGLPGVDTKQADFGFDYHLPHEVRFNSSYSRKFTPNGNGNVWDVSLTYRFLTPVWPGKKL
jgi:hypothetical protein